MEEIAKELSKYGKIEVLKVGYVFTLIMTGKNIESFKVVEGIQSIINKHIVSDFPIVEVYKNEENFLLIVLKP